MKTGRPDFRPYAARAPHTGEIPSQHRQEKKMAEKGRKMAKSSETGRKKWPKMADGELKSGRKMAENGQKRAKMAENSQIWPKTGRKPAKVAEKWPEKKQPKSGGKRLKNGRPFGGPYLSSPRPVCRPWESRAPSAGTPWRAGPHPNPTPAPNPGGALVCLFACILTLRRNRKCSKATSEYHPLWKVIVPVII